MPTDRTPDPADVERWARGGCYGIVTLDGIEDACGKPVVGIIDGRGTEDEDYWPACTYHLHRWGYGRVVPLADLIAAMRAEGKAAVRREVEAAAADMLATRYRPHPLDGSNDSYYREGWADCAEEAVRATRAALDRAEGAT